MRGGEESTPLHGGGEKSFMAQVLFVVRYKALSKDAKRTDRLSQGYRE
jgi:hypothetical protein